MVQRERGEVLADLQPMDPPQLHVLAVDDSLVDRKVIEKLLRISSCEVTAVESGTRALQYLGIDGEKGDSMGLEALKVNLIMTDYSMPGMTGYELLKRIKESSALRKIPVVIMSSENILPRIDRCLEEGAEDFLLKPIKLSDVKRLKEFVMRGEAEDGANRGFGKRKLENNAYPAVREPEPEQVYSPLSDQRSSSSEATCSPPSDQRSSSEEPCSPLSTLCQSHKRTRWCRKD